MSATSKSGCTDWFDEVPAATSAPGVHVAGGDHPVEGRPHLLVASASASRLLQRGPGHRERTLGVVQVLLGDEALGPERPGPLGLDSLQLEVRPGAEDLLDPSRATRGGPAGRPSSPGSPCPPAPRARTRPPSSTGWPGSRRAPRRGCRGCARRWRAPPGRAGPPARCPAPRRAAGAPWPRPPAATARGPRTPTTAASTSTMVPMVSARGRCRRGSVGGVTSGVGAGVFTACISLMPALQGVRPGSLPGNARPAGAPGAPSAGAPSRPPGR